MQKMDDMKYSSQGKWLIHDIFSTPLEASLDKSNRWYKLANAVPWDKIEKIYNSTLRNVHNGAGNKPARMIVGALIVKHHLCISDVEAIAQIKENPYLQYFVGMREFSTITLFDASLFVSIRKRLGVENINEIGYSCRYCLKQNRKESLKIPLRYLWRPKAPMKIRIPEMWMLNLQAVRTERD